MRHLPTYRIGWTMQGSEIESRAERLGEVDKFCDADPETGGDENLWRALIAGQAVVEQGAHKHRLSPAQQFTMDRLKKWLIQVMRSTLPAIERAEAGRVLAALGDPREEVMTVEGMQFCWVPEGRFWMGEGDALHQIALPGYWMARYPVTNAQYAAFVEDGGYEKASYWREAAAVGRWRDGKFKGLEEEEFLAGPERYGGPFALANHPQVGVSWYEALAFCRWLTERRHAEGWLPGSWAIQLPSEAEWEKAARGGEQVPEQLITYPLQKSLDPPPTTGMQRNALPKRAYPWADEADPQRANYDETNIGSTSAVGCFSSGKSPYGVEDMRANVWEWTRSALGDYPYPSDAKAREEREDPALHNTRRVYRGGAFGYNRRIARCAVRFRDLPQFRLQYFPHLPGLAVGHPPLPPGNEAHRHAGHVTAADGRHNVPAVTGLQVRPDGDPEPHGVLLEFQGAGRAASQDLGELVAHQGEHVPAALQALGEGPREKPLHERQRQALLVPLHRVAREDGLLRGSLHPDLEPSDARLELGLRHAITLLPATGGAWPGGSPGPVPRPGRATLPG